VKIYIENFGESEINIDSIRQCRVLVVEDTKVFIEAARRYFEEVKCVEVEYTSSYEGAMEKIGKENINGMLIDMFVPADIPLARKAFAALASFTPDLQDEKSFGKSLEAIGKELQKEAPVGLLIAQKAEEKGIPFVIVSSLGHHALKFEAIYQYVKGKKWDQSLQEGWQGGHVLSGKELDFLKENPQRNKDKSEFWAAAFNKLPKRS